MHSTNEILNRIHEFHHMIMVFKNEKNEMYLGHCYQNNGRDTAKYLLFLYKDILPKMDFLSAWNYLDDNSYTTVVVEVSEAETGMMDFIACYKPHGVLEDMEFVEINTFQDIQKNLNDLKKNAVKCFLM